MLLYHNHIVVRLWGLRDWAQSTHRFSICERDRAGCRVLNATVQGAVFLIPPFRVIQTELNKLYLAGSKLFAGGFGRFKILVLISACSRHEDMVQSRGNARLSSFFTYLTKMMDSMLAHCTGASCATSSPDSGVTQPRKGKDEIYLCVVYRFSSIPTAGNDIYLRDSQLYVRLRERQQRDNDLELGLESLKVSSMDLRLCGLQVWCWLVSTVSWLVVVERQLDLSSVAARLSGSPVCFSSFPTKPVTCEVHPYPFQVRESRRLPILRLVRSRTTAELGLHHQQYNLYFLFTSGLWLVRGRRSRVKLVIRLTGLNGGDRYSWIRKWQIGEIGEVVEIQQAKREQFQTLQQGNLSVLEYQMRLWGFVGREIEPRAPTGWFYLLFLAMVDCASELVEIENSGVHVVCVCAASSTTPTVVTSPVRYPRFCVSQALSAQGLFRYLCTVKVRESRKIPVLHLVQSRIAAELGLHHQQCNLYFLFTLGPVEPGAALLYSVVTPQPLAYSLAPAGKSVRGHPVVL
ncbi:hypothetical protein Taro_048029 [Colocasia esculenta]|uniref:Uncharacterized protein n=1 Tax=Colocasia esculenta TaxID=4460 RepID=A0A843WX15_COLES|nr:hypothetical protein [Colocasia esculenta]